MCADSDPGWFHTLFPLRAIWAAAFLQLIGGGGPTAITIVLVIIADVTPPEQRYACSDRSPM